MSYFKRHVFFCTNKTTDGSQCCSALGAEKARTYLKQKCKDKGIHGAGQVRVNSAGCMDRCQFGPVIVIYPEAVWYTYVDQDDLDEILESHLMQGKVVERLLLPVDEP